MVAGYCRECGKQDQPEQFEQNETDLLCCSKVTKHSVGQSWSDIPFKDGKRVHAKLKFCIAINVFDHSVALSPASKIVISSKMAEKFLGITVRDFFDSEEVRSETIGKLKALEGKLAEFCVEKISNSEVLHVSNSVIKF